MARRAKAAIDPDVLRSADSDRVGEDGSLTLNRARMAPLARFEAVELDDRGRARAAGRGVATLGVGQGSGASKPSAKIASRSTR